MSELRRCTMCGKYKDPETEFYKKPRMRCKECVKEDNRARYYRDPEATERSRQYGIRWRERNREHYNAFRREERARKRGQKGPSVPPECVPALKWCTECGEYKDRATAFGKDDAWCLECTRRWSKQRYRETHNERIAYSQRWRDAHRELVNERQRGYYYKKREQEIARRLAEKEKEGK